MSFCSRCFEKRSGSARRCLTRPGLALLLLALLPLATVRADPPASLGDQIGHILDGEATRSALWGVYVQDLGTGDVLYRHNADKAFVPASTQKLLTTATALETLGSDFRYRTLLYFDGEVDGATLRGDLIVKGSGDPTFGSLEVPGKDPLQVWAEQLAAMGVTRIEGRLVGDDDVFDDAPYASGWDVAFVSREAFATASSGLSYGDNLVRVRVRATEPGTAPAAEALPGGYFAIRNRAETTTRRGDRIRIHREFGADAIVLHGSAPSGYRGTYKLPVANPTLLALHSFREHLEAAGVEVAADLADVDALEAPPTYDRDRPLLVHLSPPLSKILQVINKESNNLYAEQVFRTFGWGGATAGGASRVKRLLRRAGVATRGLSIRDGSGLSRKDMLTPEAMGRLLAYMHTHPERDVYLASLPRGGERRSTLQHRLGGVPVHAKTGSLQYVRTLSGYVTTADGRELAFAVFANHYTTSSYRIQRAIDQIVRTLAGAPAS